MTKNIDIWEECFGQVKENRIEFVQQELDIVFPQSYLKILKKCDSGILKKNVFSFVDSVNKRTIIDSIGSFLSLNSCEKYYDEVLGFYRKPPEFFTEGLIAFGGTGGGDYICFDYRLGKKEMNPPIVYWSHESNIGEDVSFIAKNFEEFLGMLEEPIDSDLI